MKTYTYENYLLALEFVGYDGRHSVARARVRYELRDENGTIFEGDEFHPSPLHDPEGPESAEALLSFLTLREGADSKYFDEYTERQLEFRDCEAEDLYYWQEKLNPEEHKRQ